MELSSKLTTYSDTKQVSTMQENSNNILDPIWSPLFKIGEHQQKQQKAYKVMETEQLTIE